MAKKTIEMIVEKVLKRHKAEVAVLWLLVAMRTLLIMTGIGVYFYVSRLAIVQQPSLISAKYFLTAQVEMLCDFAKAIGIVFSLTGIAVIILVLDRLSFTKAAYRMASFIRKRE
ncbi:unnamed protein product, partial [marine sediment metagenome]